MPKSDYLLQYKEVKNLTIKALIERIKRCDGLSLKDLSLKDLIFFKGQAIHTGSGVYVFKNKQNLFYVGKCSKMSFIERIPSHLDTRKAAWFNALVKYVNDKPVKDIVDEDLQIAAKKAIDRFELVLINFEWDQYHGNRSIDYLEDLLRMTTNARNKFKVKSHNDLEMKVVDFIQNALN